VTGPRESRERGRLSSIFGLVLLPLLLAVVAAELYLVIRERRSAHILNGNVVSFFPQENEATVKTLRSRFVSAYPFVAPQQFVFRPYGKPPASGPIPLAGISNVTTELCNEDNRDVIYHSDGFGFNNPPEVWTSGTPDVALIGDSFVHGICVPAGDQLATLIRQTSPATLNLGVLGAGPLSELGVLREYAAPKQPRVVVWFFYEGNDIEDLEKERNSPLLQYLDPTFTQDLMSQQPAVDSMLRGFADSVLSSESTMTPGLRDLPGMLKIPRVRKAIGMVVANAPNRIEQKNFDVLDSVFAVAKREVDKWGGKLFIAYLPDYHRFDRKVLAYSGYVHNNAEIQYAVFNAASRSGIPVINVAGAFASGGDPRRYWPRPTSHYGANGYALVAQSVLSAIAQ
jgi:hypothetical protein